MLRTEMQQTRDHRIRVARVLKALAHPLRIWILEELARSGERCVCELARMSGADDSTISRHLTQLRVAGLVTDERRGLQVYCRLSGPAVVQLLQAAGAAAESGGAPAPEEWLGVC